MKTRFVFLILLGAICSSLFSASPAQAQKLLAAIIVTDLPRYQQIHEVMSNVLKTGGFDENAVKIFKQTPNGDKMSLINSMRRVEAAGANLLITYGSYATNIAQQQLKQTPLLFADAYDPVAMGTVKTLAATGAKASGGTSKTDMNTLVKNLVAIKPVQTVGVVYSKGEAGSEQQLEELQALAQKYGFAVKEQNVRNAKEALSLSKKLAKGCDALFLTESISVGQNAQAIVAAVQANKCLVFSQIPGLVAEGAVLGLEADLAEQGAIVAVYALQVLQGQQVQLFPVKEAKKISLKVNAQAAAALGLTIPTTVASQAKMM